jgi:hypothetical protein
LDWQAEDLTGPERAVMDVLAPLHHGARIPVFEWGHETTPTEQDMRELVRDIINAVIAAGHISISRAQQQELDPLLGHAMTAWGQDAADVVLQAYKLGRARLR